MNEVQGPTPAGTSRPYRSLSEGLRAHRVPVENYAFISAVLEAVGVSSLIDRGRYIEAIRNGEGAPLHIGRTYTNGFTEDEVIVVGSVPLRLQPSEGRPPYYYIVHPSESAPPAPLSGRRGSGVSTAKASAPRTPKASSSTRVAKPLKLEERDYGVCDVCFMVRRASGSCDCI